MWCVLILLVGASVAHGDDWRVVRTAQGPVRGRRDTLGDIFVYYNIPYATAPSGENKFKAPLPPPEWTEPFEAIDRGVICPQAPFGLELLKNKSTQEDCLIANVYVPDTNETDLSVLVVIHGGAFQLAYGDWFKARNLMKSKKLIVVTFNYRLGIHGFLCLGTEDAPGNAGMKDQVALLRWVNKNIANFGGNPNDVTISGFSAGGSSVDLMILSKSAVGLFKKVIVESGASTAAFSMQSDPLENARDYAKTLNFTDVDDIKALEKFYKTASYETLTLNAFFDRTESTFLFSPCVERDVGQEVFLDDFPVNILKKGDYTKVPMLYGFTNMEGLFRIAFFDFWKVGMNERFSNFLPADLKFENEDEKEEVARQIKEFYFGTKAVDNDTVLGYVAYFTDVMFAQPALRSVKLNVEAGNDQVYLFEYLFVDKNTPFVPHTKKRGADHCGETTAVMDGVNFYTNEDESTASKKYKNMKKIMRELWSNFIITGKPVPEGSSLPSWPPVGARGSPHMSLGLVVGLRGVLLERRARLWSSIYERYYREPVPPNPLSK